MNLNFATNQRGLRHTAKETTHFSSRFQAPQQCFFVIISMGLEWKPLWVVPLLIIEIKSQCWIFHIRHHHGLGQQSNQRIGTSTDGGICQADRHSLLGNET